jgi:hypothetical protein
MRSGNTGNEFLVWQNKCLPLHSNAEKFSFRQLERLAFNRQSKDEKLEGIFFLQNPYYRNSKDLTHLS